jgi:hypothetical protein
MTRPVDDPVFSAHIPYSIITPDGLNFTWYSSDCWSTMIGCAATLTTMSVHLSGGVTSLIPNILELNLNPAQIGATERIGVNSLATNIYTAVYGCGVAALRAQEAVSRLDQPPLPAN